MTTLFIINKTPTNLIFKNGYLTIARGGFGRVSAEDSTASEFKGAESRGWIEITDKEPTAITIAPVETVVISNPNQGMTADELKAHQANPDPVAPVATVEALGQTQPEMPEGKAETIGRDSTVEVDPAAETAKAEAKPKSKKAAA